MAVMAAASAHAAMRGWGAGWVVVHQVVAQVAVAGVRRRSFKALVEQKEVVLVEDLAPAISCIEL